MMPDSIKITGARENNLKNVNINIPRNTFVVITGVSGSGKSSLAFDTVYAEGQRRYVESLSTHARQFLNQMNKPDVDSIEGLSPSISIHQRVAFGSPRSTVGTTTEIYDYMRVLFAKIGQACCPKCGKPISSQTNQEIVDQLLRKKGEKLAILSPVIKNQKGEFVSLIRDLQTAGFVKARVDGQMVELEKPLTLKKTLTHDIDIVIDRLTISQEESQRLSDSVAMALTMGKGVMSAIYGEKNTSEQIFSEINACPQCGISLGTLTPGMFSFNSPFGACEMCHGLGVVELLDPALMVVDEDLSINEGCVPLITHEDVPMIEPNKRLLKILQDRYKINMDKPWRELPAEQKYMIMEGNPEMILKVPYWEEGKQKYRESSFEGFRKIFFDRFHSTEKTQPREIIKRYMSDGVCPQCKGKRLKPPALAVRVYGHSIIDMTEQSIDALYETFLQLKLNDTQKIIGKDIIDEIEKRLLFLKEVGLGYLTLARVSNTLGGGEAQRIKLATQIGSGLIGVLYVLDEPTIGLHPRDVARLLKSLKRLKELGNSLLVVEHDEATIRSAEYVIEMGPKAGVGGGNLVFEGTYENLIKSSESLTARYLRYDAMIPIPEKRRAFNPNDAITISGCTQNNLKNVTVTFPLGCIVAVTGVSGSGKSSLVDDTLYRALQQKLSRAKVTPGAYKNIFGYKNVESILEIDQSPIGRTPRSNPATYTGVFDLIRELYASLPEAGVRGYKASHFSFNVRGGRCEACQGDGIKKIEMHFLPDVYVPCEVCKGKRYDREILEIRYKGRSISDVLNSTIEEALVDFKNVPAIHEKLKLLDDVGLSYIKLGQSATTLSGGEAQRVKLAAELGNKTKGRTVYILDEPTTGLHIADIHVLLKVLQRLVDQGHSVIIIEHNLDVIASSDYIVDIGPEGGDKGGKVVACGTPEELALCKDSYTGQYLKEHFETIKALKK